MTSTLKDCTRLEEKPRWCYLWESHAKFHLHEARRRASQRSHEGQYIPGLCPRCITSGVVGFTSLLCPPGNTTEWHKRKMQVVKSSGVAYKYCIYYHHVVKRTPIQCHLSGFFKRSFSTPGPNKDVLKITLWGTGNANQLWPLHTVCMYCMFTLYLINMYH